MRRSTITAKWLVWLFAFEGGLRVLRTCPASFLLACRAGRSGVCLVGGLGV